MSGGRFNIYHHVNIEKNSEANGSRKKQQYACQHKNAMYAKGQKDTKVDIFQRHICTFNINYIIYI